ncbi:MAG: hypothetical protein LUC93_02410 [Planctomycetaceae bacterium]|nr:hypothetical protein [Planctomycetaceae bacterium]
MMHVQKNHATRGLVAMALILLAACASHASEPMLRCRFPNPFDRRELNLVFPANPLVVVPPGENLQLTCEHDGVPGSITVYKDDEPVQESSVINFSVPDRPGSYYIRLMLTGQSTTVGREICVVVPFKASASRNAEGYDLRVDEVEMGRYRHPSRSGNRKVRANPDSYQPPVWWFRITPMNSGFFVVPGLTAGELVVPSEDTGQPHTDLVPVVYSMWRTVHTLREALATQGIPGGALKIISVFRAPKYNRAIGSNAFGRHIYGDAFDFYIDLEGDTKASDLNRDGKRDRRDAYPVVALIEDLMDDGKIPMGGIGIYNTIGGDHEVTMHIDNRGHRATWGFLYSASGKRSNFAWESRRFAELDRREENEAAELAKKEGRAYARPRREPLPATSTP